MSIIVAADAPSLIILRIFIISECPAAGYANAPCSRHRVRNIELKLSGAENFFFRVLTVIKDGIHRWFFFIDYSTSSFANKVARGLWSCRRPEHLHSHERRRSVEKSTTFGKSEEDLLLPSTEPSRSQLPGRLHNRRRDRTESSPDCMVVIRWL